MREEWPGNEVKGWRWSGMRTRMGVWDKGEGQGRKRKGKGEE